MITIYRNHDVTSLKPTRNVKISSRSRRAIATDEMSWRRWISAEKCREEAATCSYTMINLRRQSAHPSEPPKNGGNAACAYLYRNRNFRFHGGEGVWVKNYFCVKRANLQSEFLLNYLGLWPLQN